MQRLRGSADESLRAEDAAKSLIKNPTVGPGHFLSGTLMVDRTPAMLSL
jgi:hypothetical protein